MAPSQTLLLLIYLPRKDEWLSLPGWLTYSGRFTHISCHSSAAGRAQDRDMVKDRCSTTLQRNQRNVRDRRIDEQTESILRVSITVLTPDKKQHTFHHF